MGEKEKKKREREERKKEERKKKNREKKNRQYGKTNENKGSECKGRSWNSKFRAIHPLLSPARGKTGKTGKGACLALRTGNVWSVCPRRGLA